MQLSALLALLTLTQLITLAEANYHRLIHIGDAAAKKLCPLEVRFTTNLVNHVPTQYLRSVRLAAVLQYLQAQSTQVGASTENVDWVVMDDSADSSDNAAEYGMDTDPMAWTFNANNNVSLFTIYGGTRGISKNAFQRMRSGLNVKIINRTEAPCAMCDSVDATSTFTDQCSSSEDICDMGGDGCPTCQSTGDQINNAGVGAIGGAALIAITPLVQMQVTQGAAAGGGLAGAAMGGGLQQGDINDAVQENVEDFQENAEALEGEDESQFILLCY